MSTIIQVRLYQEYITLQGTSRPQCSDTNASNTTKDLNRCDPDLVSDQLETQHETLASHIPDTREVVAQLFQLEEVVGSHFLAHLLALVFLYYLHLHRDDLSVLSSLMGPVGFPIN